MGRLHPAMRRFQSPTTSFQPSNAQSRIWGEGKKRAHSEKSGCGMRGVIPPVMNRKQGITWIQTVDTRVHSPCSEKKTGRIICTIAGGQESPPSMMKAYKLRPPFPGTEKAQESPGQLRDDGSRQRCLSVWWGKHIGRHEKVNEPRVPCTTQSIIPTSCHYMNYGHA